MRKEPFIRDHSKLTLSSIFEKWPLLFSNIVYSWSGCRSPLKTNIYTYSQVQRKQVIYSTSGVLSNKDVKDRMT